MKRVLSLLLALCLAAVMLPLSAAAAADSGSCGNHAQWQLQNGILIISGSGPMTDYDTMNEAPWTPSRDKITWAVIGDGITRVGSYAFYGCRKMTSVQMASTVSSIGDNAFFDCRSLTSVDLPAGLRSMGTAAFSRCTALTEISRWGNLTGIPRFAFNECTSLKKVPELTDNITSVGDSAFYRCTSLTYLVLPRTLRTIGGDAFHGSGLTALTLPDSVTSVGDFAFAECPSLQAIIVPQALLDTAGDLAFALCNAQIIPVGDPAPVDPTPVDPTPVDPTPVDPTPVDPTPVDPTPVDPTPEEPLRILRTEELEDGKALVVSENDRRTQLELFDANGLDIATVSIPFQARETVSYPDVAASSWYAPYVRYVTTAGIFSGDAEGFFNPNGAMSRAMVVSVLYRLAGSPSVEGYENAFADVSSHSWYAEAVLWASHWGVVSGSEGFFQPNRAVTREQLVSFLHRFARLMNRESDRRVPLFDYPDNDSVSLYAMDDMAWAVAQGLIAGVDGELRPRQEAVRSQASTVLTKFLQLLADPHPAS